MKTLIKYFSISLIGLAAINSCKFNEDINRDPVNPIDAPMSALLTTSEVGIAYTVGGNIARYNGMFTQQLAGVDRQSLTIGRYNIGQQDTDDPWDNMFRFMKSLRVIITKADAQGSQRYKGVSQILMAYSLGTVTDQWGDVPYSEALRGESDGSGLRPKYDSQQNLYDTIQVLLSKGIANCKISSAIRPGVDDVIYNGDMSKWVALGYSLKARYAIHTSKRNVNAYTNALAFADSAGTVTSALVGFPGTSATNENPMYQFDNQRGDIVVASSIVKYFRSTTDSLAQFSGDPRLFATTDFGGDSLWVEVTKKDDGTTDTLYRAFQPYGAQPGEQDFGTVYYTPDELEISVSYAGSYLSGRNATVALFQASELDFIKAEASLALGQNDNAATSHNNGIAASISEMGVSSDPGFIAGFGSETGATISLVKIMTQKWVALFGNGESWTDWRRTGFPVLSPAANNSLNGSIPRRYPYPQKERTLNGANVPSEGSQPALTRVWWDL